MSESFCVGIGQVQEKENKTNTCDSSLMTVDSLDGPNSTLNSTVESLPRPLSQGPSTPPRLSSNQKQTSEVSPK